MVRTTTTLIAAPNQGRIVVRLPVLLQNCFFGEGSGYEMDQQPEGPTLDYCCPSLRYLDRVAEAVLLSPPRASRAEG